MENGENTGAPFVVDGDAAETAEPCKRTLDHPSVSAKALTALDATPGDARNDSRWRSALLAVGEIVALVGVQFGWPAR